MSNLSITSGTTTYQATNSITASTVTVSGSASVTFMAGSYVRLSPGFHATAGSGSPTFHAITNYAPSADSVSPNSGSGSHQAFTLTTSDADGATDISGMQFAVIGSDGNPTCNFWITRASRVVQIMDNGTWSSPMVAGQAGTLPNAQCSLNMATSSVSWTGTTATVVLDVSFAPAYAGNKLIYAQVEDNEGLSSPWVQRGTWTVTAAEFALTTSLTSGQVYPGGTATYSVTVTPVNGFTGTVTLTATGLPTGATASFSPASLTINGAAASSTLSVATTASTPVGPTNFTVTATNWALVHSVTPSLQLQDFTFTGLPATMSVPAGNTTTATLSVSAVNGFTGTVTPTATGLPTGVTASFSPATVTGSGTTTLTLTGATGTAPSGSASTVTVTGTATGATTLTHTQTTAVSVTNSAPSADSVSPSSGNGWQQVFTLTTSDANSATDISGMQFAVIGSDGNPTCNFWITRASRVVQIMDGGAWSEPKVAGQAGTLSNAQCIANMATSSVAWTGTTATVVLDVSFAATYAGNKLIYAQVEDNEGLFSSWVQRGTWTVTVAPPPDFTVTASLSSGQVYPGGTATYTVTVTPANGFTGTVGLAASGLPTGATPSFNPASVTVSGSAVTSTLSLATTASTPPGPSTFTVTATSGSLTHSVTPSLGLQDFTFTGLPATMSVQAGGTATATLSVTAVNGFTGTVTPAATGLPAGVTASFSPATVTGSGTTTLTLTGAVGSVPSTSASTVTVTGTVTGATLAHTQTTAVSIADSAPSADSVSPSSGSGFHQVFTFTTSDVNGAEDIQAMDLSIGGYPNGCEFWIHRWSRGIWLRVDDGSGWTPVLTAGQSGYQENSQCRIDAPTSSITWSGTTVTVALDVTFKAAYVGAKPVTMNVVDNEELRTGTVQRGTWTVPTSTAPTVVSGTPVSSSTTPQAFTFTVRDADGYLDINRVSFLVHGDATVTANSCYGYYDRASNGIFLYDDAGTTVGGPITGGVAGTLQNGQCSVDGATSALVSATGTDLVVRFGLGLQTGYAASTKNVYVKVADNEAHETSWAQTATWTVSSQPVREQTNSHYVLTLTPKLQIANPTDTAVYTVKTTAMGDFTGTINLAAVGLAGGMSASFNPAQVTVGGTSTLTVTTTGVLVGDYVFGVSGTSGTDGAMTLANLTVSNAGPPSAVSVEPSSGSGWGGVFTFTFANPNASNQFGIIQIDFHAGDVTAANSCYVYFDPGWNRFWLVNDNGQLEGSGHQPGYSGSGDTGVAGNQRCSVNFAKSSVISQGKVEVVTLKMRFQNYLGPKNIWMKVNASGMDSAWTQRGTYTVTADSGPGYSVGLSPSSISRFGGQTAVYVASVDTTDSFVGNILLNASGGPPNSNLLLNWSTFSESGIAYLMVTPPSNAAPGTTTVSLTGNSVGVTNPPTATASLVIGTVPTFDFADTREVSISVNRGATIVLSEDLVANGEFNDGVTLSYAITQVPPDPIPLGYQTVLPVAIQPTTVGVLPATPHISFSPSDTTAAGNYRVVLTATGGGITHTKTITVTVVQPSYSLSQPAPVTVQAGGSSATTSTTITRLGGHNSNISFTVTLPQGWPSGLSVVPLTRTVDVNTPSMSFEVTANAAVAPRSYNFTVDATDAGGQAAPPMTVSVTVTPAKDYNLTPSPTPVYVQRDVPSTVTAITITPSNGYVGTITLTTTTSGFAFSPNQVDLTDTSSRAVRVNAGPSVTPGSYALDVTANDGTTTKTLTVQVIVTLGATPQLTITTTPSGLAVICDGVAYTSPFTVAWSAGVSHTVSVATPQTVATGQQAVFQRWTLPDGSTQTTTSVTVTPAAGAGDQTLAATFQTQYQVTTAVARTDGGSVPGGSIQATVDGTTLTPPAWVNNGATVNLSANPAAGFTFSKFTWTAGGQTTDLSGTTLTASGPGTVTAVFAPAAATVKEYIRLNGRVIAIEQH